MPAPEDLTTTFGQRLHMYLLQFASAMGTKIARAAIPSLIPLLGTERAWTQAQMAMLNSAFSTGYIVTQVPGAPLIQRYGSKVALTVGHAGTAVAFMSIPMLRTPGSVAVALALMGIVQGPLGPAWSSCSSVWMPWGTHEQAWAMRFQGLSHVLSPLFAAFLVPRLVARGMQAPWVILGSLAAAITVIYHALAAEEPPPKQGTTEATTSATKRDWGEWGIFRVPAVHSFLGYFFAKGAAELMMLQTAPIYFVEKFGLSPAAAGAYIAAAKIVNVPASFFTGAVESFLKVKGVPTRRIRQLACAVASVGCSVSMVLYGMAPTPRSAMLLFSCFDFFQSFNASGLWASMVELGGPDSAIMNSVGNTGTNLPGVFVAPLALLLRQRTGTWVAQYAAMAALLVPAGAWYCLTCSTRTCRELLYEQREQRNKQQGQQRRNGN